MPGHPDFDRHPFVVIWEITRSCSLACRHCRAEANPKRDTSELSFWQGIHLIDQVAEANPAVFVLTGGDPMRRDDLPTLLSYSHSRGLRVSLSPSATPRLADADFAGLGKTGLRRISISLDGATRESHDAFRGVRGVWNWSMKAFQRAREAGLEVQINTTFSNSNLGEFDRFADLMGELRPALWNIFLLVPTGRAAKAEVPSPENVEQLFSKLAGLSTTAPFAIKTTEGQHYRRVALQHWSKNGGKKPTTLGVNDGKGFVFISHTGDVQPSGFLPIPCGNVREKPLLQTYRESPVFRRLRDPDQLGGKCGHCEYRSICGGSRARSYALTGDYMAQEVCCPHQPSRTSASHNLTVAR